MTVNRVLEAKQEIKRATLVSTEAFRNRLQTLPGVPR